MNASLSSLEKESSQELPLAWRKSYVWVAPKQIERENSTQNPKFSFGKLSTIL